MDDGRAGATVANKANSLAGPARNRGRLVQNKPNSERRK